MRASAASLSAAVIFSFLMSRSRLPDTVARPFFTAASEMSTITASMPATAQACAMPLPMVPAPMMPTVLIVIGNPPEERVEKTKERTAEKPISRSAAA